MVRRPPAPLSPLTSISLSVSLFPLEDKQLTSMPLSERQIPPGIDSRRVYVGNLGWGVAWQDLKDHMRKAGEVIRAEV
jgi:RNA recognition motif-containing protein